MQSHVPHPGERRRIESNPVSVPAQVSALPVPTGGMVEQVMKGVQEVTARVYSAKMCPRDVATVRNTAIAECENVDLAEIAHYAYPKGGKTVTGPSIRLIETIAANYGNLQFGVKEVERRKGESSMIAEAWDFQTNTRRIIEWIQPHTIDTKKGPKHLHDDRDIYTQIMNMGARRMRKALEDLLPKTLIKACEAQCTRTLGSKQDLAAKKERLVKAFEEFGVSEAMIRKRAGGKEIRALIPTEIVELIRIYNSIKDGMTAVEDFFETPADPAKVVAEQKAAGKEAAAKAKAADQKKAEESDEGLLPKAMALLQAEAIEAEAIGVDVYKLLNVSDLAEIKGLSRIAAATDIVKRSSEMAKTKGSK